MKLLVGLGNPGAKYEQNRHNIGFMAVDEIARIHGFSSWRKRFQGECAEGVIDGEKCLLLKPTTYMNESGRAVREAANFYKIEPEDIVVFHDELDLAPGKLKVKSGGGNAGHNGLKSISAHVSNDYVRIRMGIGHPGRKDLVHIYVLQDFAKSEKQWLEPLIDAVGRSTPYLVQGDSARFLTDVAQQINPNPKNENKKAANKGGKTSETNTTPKAASKAEKEQTKKDGALADQLKRWRGNEDN